LRLLFLGSLLRAVVTLAICAARAERRPSVVIGLHGSLAVIVPMLAWHLIPRLDAAGAALAWTIGHAAVAVLAAFLTRHLLGRREQRRPALRTLVDHHASEAP
jgi:hypothetical protein